MLHRSPTFLFFKVILTLALLFAVLRRSPTFLFFKVILTSALLFASPSANAAPAPVSPEARTAAAPPSTQARAAPGIASPRTTPRSPAPPAQAEALWTFRTFSAKDGLAHDIVRDLLEAEDSELWFATMGGITRYDPASCRYRSFDFDIAARRRVMALARGHDAAIWAATQGGGVGRYAEGRWRWFTAKDGLPRQEAVTALLVDHRGQIWATPTGGGLLVYDGKTWRRHGPKEGLDGGELGHCIETRAHAILCATYAPKRLRRYEGQRWTTIPVEDIAGREFYVHDLLETDDGRIWLATKGAGVILGTPDPKTGTYRWNVPKALHLASRRVGAIFAARDGRLWFATAGGVSVFDGQHTRSFSRADGLGSSHVFAISQTRDGALWFATLGGGASRYGPSRWRREGVAQGLPSATISGGLLCDASGAIWAGTDEGLARRREGQGLWTALPSGTPTRDQITDLAKDPRGGIWVGTRHGVSQWRAGRWRHDPGGPKEIVPHQVTALAVAPNDVIWVGTPRGVRRLQRNRWRSYGRHEGLPDVKVNALLVDRRRRVWAATNNGAAVLESDHSIWRSFATSSSAISRTNRIYRLAEDARGGIWASGLDGVSVFRAGAWRRLPPSAWLPDGIYSRFLLHTSDGSLWFAVRGLGVRRRWHGRWTAYSSRAGLAPETVRDVLRLPNGDILFATLGGGISVYRPDRHPPQTYVGQRPGSPPPRKVLRGGVFIVPFGGQDVLQDTPTDQLQYAWRLDRGSWSPFALKTRARLTNLASGPHRFEVRAMDRDLNIDPSPALHRFIVVRPWYGEPWLWALLVAAFLALVYAGLRVALAMRRERRAIVEEQRAIDQRKHFVRLASHELRKPLTRMAHRAEMLTMPEMQDQRDLIARYADALVKDSGHLARLVESLLDQAKVEEGLYLDRKPHDLRALVDSIVRDVNDDNFRVDADLPVSSVWTEIDPLYVQMALRNLLDNAQKYAGTHPRVAVTLRVADGRAVLRVCDEGPGIHPEEAERIFQPFHRGKTSPEHGGFGLGLPLARDIARAHGGDLVLETPGKDQRGKGQPKRDQCGACFTLTLPTARRPDA